MKEKSVIFPINEAVSKVRFGARLIDFETGSHNAAAGREARSRPERGFRYPAVNPRGK
jgi:hypothetical protein